MKSIVALTGLELESAEIDKTVAWYSNLFGLEISSRESGRVSLKGIGHETRQLVIRAATHARLGGLAFELDPSGDLRHFAEVIGARGVRVRPISDVSLSFEDPDGTTIVVSQSPNWRAEGGQRGTDRPMYMSHVVLNSPHPERLIEFYVDTLGFRISDKYERGLLTLLRCHQPQHHCLGIAPASYSGLNHFAMDCGTIDAVMTGVGRMKRAGIEPIWGPGRHGPGGNVFCYFEDPNGFVAEFTCEVLSIPDGDRWEPKEWARTPENANVWGTGGASPRAIKLMNDNPPAN
jgi:catechol 2,3-dioxygenase-like lactoylglutathione lyase family enzyme